MSPPTLAYATPAPLKPLWQRVLSWLLLWGAVSLFAIGAGLAIAVAVAMAFDPWL